MGSKDQGSEKVSVGAWEARMSWTRTKPSNQPETMIWSEAPHGDAGGAEEMPYTAVGRSWSASPCGSDGRSVAVGVGEMEVGVMAWMVSGVSDDVPKAAKGVEAEVERSADQARVSRSIMCGREGCGEDRSRRPALPLVDTDSRVLPETASASISSPSW